MYEVVAFALILATGSMEPTLSAGDRVELLETDGYVENGQIIVFNRDNSLVMHRVFTQIGECIITKGDALLLPDFGCQEPVYETGKIIQVVR